MVFIAATYLMQFYETSCKEGVAELSRCDPKTHEFKYKLKALKNRSEGEVSTPKISKALDTIKQSKEILGFLIRKIGARLSHLMIGSIILCARKIPQNHAISERSYALQRRIRDLMTAAMSVFFVCFIMPLILNRRQSLRQNIKLRGTLSRNERLAFVLLTQQDSLAFLTLCREIFFCADAFKMFRFHVIFKM